MKSHTDCVNTMAWAPHASSYIASAGDDAQTFIWDINIAGPVKSPVHACAAEDAVTQLQWFNTQPDRIAICYNNCLKILRL